LFEDGRFWHADGKARFVATVTRAPAHAAGEEYPYILNTGRIRDQWHTMTRTGRSPRLAGHLPEPFVDLHAQDALLAGVRAGELARVQTRWGSMIVRVRTSGDMARGTAFAPIHWGSARASEARVGALVSPVVDPVSGEPEFKHTPARVEPFVVDWYGFVLTRQALEAPDVSWWTVIKGEQFYRYEIAGRGIHAEPTAWLRGLLRVSEPDADYIDYRDAAAGVYRAAHIVDDRLVSCAYVSRRPDLPDRNWLGGLFKQRKLDEPARAALLAGRLPGARTDLGPVVCSCFGVGRGTLCETITKYGLKSAQQVGARVRAGTNCGSCLPEIRSLLALASAASVSA
jgi:assimilatory nitrate reductase catalytic subunit